jgi:hypothetical protein
VAEVLARLAEEALAEEEALWLEVKLKKIQACSMGSSSFQYPCHLSPLCHPCLCLKPLSASLLQLMEEKAQV